jgi:hypothetical protein
MSAPPELVAAVRERVLPREPSPDAALIARTIAEAAPGAVAAVVFFGSRKSRARPDPHSAYDLFVVAEDPAAFYGALAASARVRRGPGTLAALQRVLPPNVISLTVDAAGSPARAKCAVVTLRGLRRQTSAERDDHFFAGRLFQSTEIVYAAPGLEDEVVGALAAAHALTYDWVRPWLPARFDVDEYCRTALRVSFGGEIRPEPEGRSDALFEAQAEYLRAVYGIFLRALADAGELRAEAPGVYRLARPANARERARVQRYFGWSKVRATARWGKYVVTFDDWLEFIVRKARRHTGEDIVLTERERRMPLVFLWPRVIHYLRHKDRGR